MSGPGGQSIDRRMCASSARMARRRWVLGSFGSFSFLSMRASIHHFGVPMPLVLPGCELELPAGDGDAPPLQEGVPTPLAAPADFGAGPGPAPGLGGPPPSR